VIYVLVHGAANGPWVFDGWEEDLGAPCIAVDLRSVVAPRASMLDYATEIASAAAELDEPPVLVGWSLGGLAAMLAVKLIHTRALVVLEPSAPAEVIGTQTSYPLREGLYTAVHYGIEPGAPIPAGLTDLEWFEVIEQCQGAVESRWARHERTRGIPVAPIDVPLLVVYGDVESFAAERGPSVAQALGGQQLLIPGASHWALVVGEQYRYPVRKGILDWVAQLR
jgi:pimeloyl-ACP methyl ester carboxylesterase